MRRIGGVVKIPCIHTKIKNRSRVNARMPCPLLNQHAYSYVGNPLMMCEEVGVDQKCCATKATRVFAF